MPHKLLLPWSASTWQHRADHENWWKMVKPSESYNIYYNFSENLKELGHWIRKWHEITLNTDNQLILDIQTIGLDQSIGVLDFWMMTRPDAVPPFLLHQFHPMEIPSDDLKMCWFPVLEQFNHLTFRQFGGGMGIPWHALCAYESYGLLMVQSRGWSLQMKLLLPYRAISRTASTAIWRLASM